MVRPEPPFCSKVKHGIAISGHFQVPFLFFSLSNVELEERVLWRG